MSGNQFNQLSIRDLIEARDLFHVHLMNKKNVVATAIGRYLLRKSEFDAAGVYHHGDGSEPRTLTNSIVANISWPCILVFVSNWEQEQVLASTRGSDIVPKSIYLPDGRVVPICITLLSGAERPHSVALNSLQFPTNLIGGGFPVYVKSQGETHVATVGCLVSDGHTYYGLTNKHVSGDEGEIIYSLVGRSEKIVGKSSGKSLGKLKFSDLYPGWQGTNLLTCCDAGLFRIEDVGDWKTDVLGVQQTDELYDLNTFNLTLALIAEHKIEGTQVKDAENGQVVGFGAASGPMKGEITALFYRYKSMGGIEYVSDFMITGRSGASLGVAHGNSGALFLLETGGPQTKYQPIALHWGQHEYFDSGTKSYNFSLSTSLSNVLRELDVELVRGWQTDTDYSWGKIGHYKIAATACDLVKSKHLLKLLQANKKNIAYTDEALESRGPSEARWGKFVPLADVPDIVWRMTRKSDEANHFADMDKSDSAVEGGKTLLDLCKQSKNIDIDVWNTYYEQLEAVKSSSPAKRGALPFRVWQAFDLMVESLKAGDVERFIVIGGTAAHYLGDACQPLHISYLHHGHPDKPDEKKVHSLYESTLLDRYVSDLIQGVNKALEKSGLPSSYKGGKAAASATIKMMRQIIELLPPEEIITAFNEQAANRLAHMWETLGERTTQCLAAGAVNLALFWESAWQEGGGDQLPQSKLVKISQARITQLYSDLSVYPSFRLNDSKFKKALNPS